MKKVTDIEIKKGDEIKEVIENFSNIGGFNGMYFYEGIKIIEKMIKDKDCKRILSFTGNIISTGVRGIIKDFLKNKFFDVVITTCGAIDHDLARSFSDYYCGSFFVDDRELVKRKLHRLGNVFIPFKNYGEIIEKKVSSLVEKIKDKELSSYEFCWELGKFINKEDSFLYQSYKNKIPVIVPGFYDGAVGYQIWYNFQKNKKVFINLIKDEQFLSDFVWNSKKIGALIIGGGISKHHTIWWAQFKNGLDYSVYITTSTEYDGSLSGARTREAISWRKVIENALHVTI
ncbi:MAG: deoxyhypusine synthase, partial [Candidatus Aenigmarchaeota archaeon]|nr:deoxyhypusine synthase [Candidatus Aenigmarchaeota archaeon]MDW8149438.1 deoxyhypusine synthase [Candidatus Aenigmarchaeota archaeon]